MPIFPLAIFRLDDLKVCPPSIRWTDYVKDLFSAMGCNTHTWVSEKRRRAQGQEAGGHEAIDCLSARYFCFLLARNCRSGVRSALHQRTKTEESPCGWTGTKAGPRGCTAPDGGRL